MRLKVTQAMREIVIDGDPIPFPTGEIRIDSRTTIIALEPHAVAGDATSSSEARPNGGATAG
jgi:hypothetical protein